MDKEDDPELKKTANKIDNDTAAFLGEVINEVHNTSERNILVNKLKEEMTRLIFEQMQFDVQIKNRIAQKKRKM